MRKTIIALAVSVILLPSLALADGYKGENGQPHHLQFNGPVDLTPLVTLQNMTIGEQNAIIEGKIVRQLANGKFLLSDGQSEMVIDLDDDIYLGQSINEQTRLRLFGEYEAWKKEFEVDRVQVL